MNVNDEASGDLVRMLKSATDNVVHWSSLTRPASYLIGTVASFWMIERVAGFWV